MFWLEFAKNTFHALRIVWKEFYNWRHQVGVDADAASVSIGIVRYASGIVIQ
jgi:hypothetical protein